MLVYAQLAVATALNIIAIYFLKKAHGFTHFWPVVGNLITIMLTGWLISRSMASGMNIGIAMTFVTVGVTAGSILIGIFMFHETMTAQKLIGLSIAIVGLTIASLAKT